MKIRLPICWAFVTATLFLAGCDVRVGDNGVSVDIAHGKATEEWTRSYSIAPGGQFEIINVNGAIEVTAASGSAVEVHAIREARASSDEAAQAVLKTQPRIDEQVAAGHVKVEVSPPANSSGGFSATSTSVQFRVAVPAGLEASFRTRNGRVRLDDVDGRFEAQTTNGGVVGRGVKGSVRASTANGGVQMAVDAVRGDVDLHAVNGGIRLEVPPGLNADIEAATVNGGVVLDDTLSLTTTERSRTRIVGRLNKGGPRIVAQTTNGAVRVIPRADR
jgi:hypothetical protein